ncbi:MAG: DUF1275 domain-containing protein [Acidobacteriaceae bacterium]|nr:DUF1275 domain-containing protein [Acidobacteriaceae bacterium]
MAAVLLPAVLSTTAGAVDVIGFLSLGGLFTAHITGNVVVLAAHYVTGGFGQVGPLLAVPIFVFVLGAVVLVFGRWQNIAASRRALLTLHAVLLAGCLGLGIGYGPFRDPDTGMAVLTGMLAVSAMATQNALVKLALIGAPSTAVMTTNTTQLVIDLLAARSNQRSPADLARTRKRATVTFASIAGFTVGCVAGAILELHLGIRAMALPAVLAIVAVPLGEFHK